MQVSYLLKLFIFNLNYLITEFTYGKLIIAYIYQLITKRGMVVIFPTQDQVANFINGFVSNVSGKVNITITLDSTPHQKTLTSKKGHNNYVTLPVYFGDDDISGRIDLQLRDSYKYDHLGLKCFLIGYLEIYNDSNLSTEFTLLSKELQPAGYLTSNKFFKFKFSHFDKQYESFKGSAGCVRYFIRASLQRNVVGPLILEQEFAVTVADRVQKMPLVPTILDVGVNDRLQIQFILQKNAYHTKEWVEGKVKFLKLKMPVIKMEISLVRKETLGTADSTFSQSKVLQVFQVMDGCPDEGDMVPFRMCMRGVKNLTPSYKSIHNRLFVRHWFTVTIYDQQGSKYFKQSEITFYRK